MGEIASSAEDKARVYGLCANIFAKEPTPQFLQILKQKENEALFKGFGIDLLAGIKKQSPANQAEMLAVEYAGLFLAPGTDTSPRESLQRGEGRLWGDTTVEVNRIYKKFGFTLDEDFKDTPDHLSAELAFLSKLSELEKEYAEQGLKGSKEGVRSVKKYFLKNHLLKWFPSFKGKVVKQANLSYYKEVLNFLEMALNAEMDGLKDVAEIGN